MASPTAEQRELTLIGKVEMRIALADSDSKLEATLKTYLPPLLLKMASEHVSVRNKVVSVCQHISTRTKPQSIQLPVAALVKQFKEQENSFIRHFDFVYIQQGVNRLPSTEKATLLPLVVGSISKSGKHGAQTFNLLLRLLESFPLPLRGTKEDRAMREDMAVSEADASYLASWLGKFLLFVPQKGPAQTCPGLTPEDCAFIGLQRKDDLFNPAAGGLNLLRTKSLGAKLLASGLFTDHERFLPALFASADQASSVSDVGDDMMKRAMPVANLEDEMLVKQFFGLYFGQGGAPRVRAPLGLKILGLLSKSTKSTTFANDIMRIVDDGISVANTDGEDVVMTNGPISANTGREATKLRTAIFAYVNFVARNGSSETLHVVAQRVVVKLREYIENQGWPKPGLNEDLVSRAYAFEVIGLLAKAGPKDLLVEQEHPSLDLLRWLFESLARDSSGNSIIVSIEESLSTVLSAMSRIKLTNEEQSVLEELLIDQMTQSANLEANKRLRSTGYVAIRFTNRCLPYASIKARWINILGLGATNDRAEVREEAERGLSPYWYRMLNGSVGAAEASQVNCPVFEQLMAQFFSGRTTDTDEEPMAVAQQACRLHPSSFQAMTSFARRIMFHEALLSAGIAVDIDSEWERRIDTAIESDEKARDVVAKRIEHLWSADPQPIGNMLSALFVGLTEKTSSGAGDQLIQFLALVPDGMIRMLVPHAKTLMPVIRVNDHSRRIAAAHAYAILASHEAAAELGETREQMRQLASIVSSWNSAVGAAANQVHGATVALGFLFSRMFQRGQSLSELEPFSPYIKTLTDILTQSRDATLQEAVFSALGQLSMYSAISADTIDAFVKISIVIDKLYETAKTGNEPAILCLGQLSMIFEEKPEDEKNELTMIENHLRKLHEIRQAEVHFAVGEAFSYVACGWGSDALATKFDTRGDKPHGPDRSATLIRIFDRVLTDCTTTKPALRQAAVMWLLCLVQFCGGKPEVQGSLPKCQAAFRRCLSDSRSLVQESASRGLGLVYEKGSRELKNDLVRELVTSFSSDRQSQLAGNVSADTQLFEPGQLPTGDGSVSSYADIMSLASEVGGDSSLVYRFMSMASSNAIWSTRAAFGKFGLSNVLSDSSVDGYLSNNPKLYPKLFRYRFDPKSGESMEVIWKALVKDSATTIDTHFSAIMDDLLISILGKEWRVRQASCAGIADLVQGRPIDKYEQYVERIWTQCFKVLDDIKESVRAAAASLARTLTGVLTRTLEADHSSTKNAAAMLKHVLPFLLSPSGMESSAKEVQMFSVHTLLEIIKKSNGQTLRPFIPELVERLLGLLSSLEPEAVNYVHLNAAKYNLTEQKIDDMRLSSIRSSPLMEAIERCLDLLDDETMQNLQPKLENSMKSAVGLPSKVGASRVLVSLSTRRVAVFRPFAGAILKLIEKVVLDRNETVSSSYAVAAGYVARAATDKQILRLLTFAQGLYFESEGDRESAVPRKSITAGEILFAMSKYANDRFNALAASALPFAFVAKHDSNEAVKEQFQNTWNESVGGSRAVALYLDEIIALCVKYLDSPQWALKHTAARTVAACVISLASMEKELSRGVASTLWPALEKALGGKTWDGKEEVLPAFTKYVEAGKAYYVEQPALAANIIKVAIREAKRQNDHYRPHAIKCLGRVARARADTDLSETLFEIAMPLFEDAPDGEAMEVDAGAGSSEKDALRNETLAATVEAMFASINPALASPVQLTLHISRTLKTVAALASPTMQIWRSTYTGMEDLFARLDQDGGGGQVVSGAIVDLKAVLVREPGTEALRLLRANAVVAAAQLSPQLKAEMQAAVQSLYAEEKSPTVRDRLRQAKA